MPTTKKTFHIGRMNLDDDERFLQNGEYREAYGVDVINSEGSDVGSVEKRLSNKKLTFFDVGENPYDLGKFEDQKNSKLYWFHLNDNGAYLFEWDEKNETQSIVLADTRIDDERVLNLNKDYLITGISKILSEDGENDLLLATDDNMEILCINIERAKGYGVNGFEKEDIYLIKKPPSFAPKTTLILDDSEGNYIADKFFCFAYRYRYLDGEYSALSNLSIYNFIPKGVDFDYFECQNKGMVNAFNAINIKFNTGDKRVTHIQIISKQSNSNTPYIVETFNKVDLGWSDNQEQNFNFYNNKIYLALPEKELYRHFDNIPRKAKSLATPFNIVLLGNYLEGYNLVNEDGDNIILDYIVDFNSYSNESSFDFTTSIVNTVGVSSVFQVDAPMEDVFIEGYSIGLSISFTIDGSESYSNGFIFILNRDYVNFADLFADPLFESFIATINQDIESNYIYNLDPTKVVNQHPYIETSYLTGEASFTLFPLIIDNIDPPSSLEVVETNFVEDSTELTTQKTNQGLSCKTNRSYEVALIYKDEFKRASTALTVPINSVYIKQILATEYNKLQVSIFNNAPSFAKYVSFAVKAQPLTYQTVIITQFYQEDNYTWCLLQSDNKDKVKVGDLLIPKLVPDIAVNVNYIKVLEIKTQERNFIEGNLDNEGEEIKEPSGVYMKIRPSGFPMDARNIDIHSDTGSESAKGDNYPKIHLDLFSSLIDATMTHLEIPQGTYIYLRLSVSRKQNSNGWHRYNYEKEFFANTNYNTIEDWINNVLLSTPVNFIYDIEGEEQPSVDLSDNIEVQKGTIETLYGVDYIEEDPNGKAYLVFTSNRRGSASRSAYINGEIIIRIGAGQYIFETAPKQIEQETFYETSQEFEIVDGNHQGNIQNQNGADPAIIELDFFNCYSFGNGIESYRVRDGLLENSLNIDTRPTSTSIEPYKAVRRFADWTYGEAYIESSGINGINAFNASTANFKEGDKQYGSIQILFSRDTDVVSIQEHKAFKILFGKDLISTAEGVPVISTSPKILGQLIPFKGDNGIGLHPESFAYDSFRAWYFCPDNSTPVRLSLDGTTPINYKMVDFFRDLTLDSYGSKKIGGYDPHKELYILTSEDSLTPQLNAYCGNIIYKEISSAFDYTFLLNDLGGDIVLQYEVLNGEANFLLEYNGQSVNISSTTSGNLLIPRNDLDVKEAFVTVTPISESVTFSITNICPIGIPLTITHIVLCDDDDLGKTIVNRHSYDSGSPFSRNILFSNSEINNFIVEQGLEGVGSFPVNGSSISLQSYKTQLNTASFLKDNGNGLGYLITDQNYTENDIETILNNTNYLTVSETQLGTESFLNTGSFTFNRPTLNDNLYLVWDYRNAAITQSTNIIIYFDSSGSMNTTLTPLNTMRDTLLKDALLPVYGYDEDLYDSKVSVISEGNERTLDMLNLGGLEPEGNVIVLVFQDEANNVYHVSATPFDDSATRTVQYDTDVATFRNRLQNFSPNYYRGVMFQVNPNQDIGFKGLIEAIQNGTGNYAGTSGLSDRTEINYRYDITDGGTPEYYLQVISEALEELGIYI